MKKILLLDDNEDILDVVKEILVYERFEVKSSGQSASFTLLAEQFNPDLIILDYRLTDGNGGDLCRQLKRHPRLKHIPIMMWSAYMHPDLNFFEFGCEAVLSKPFDLQVLLQTIRNLTGISVETDGEAV